MLTLIYLYDEDTPPTYKTFDTLSELKEFVKKNNMYETDFMIVEGRVIKTWEQKF